MPAAIHFPPLCGETMLAGLRPCPFNRRVIYPLDNSRYNAYSKRVAKGESTTKSPRASRSLEQEAYLSLQRTADHLARGAEEAIKPSGLSGTQYNVLRILRGAGPHGLCCREVAERMLTHDPDITRLMDRLEKRGLTVRARESKDRRVITVRIAPEGLRILAELDGPIEEFHRRQLGHLGKRRLQLLMEILEVARVTSR
jgi:DNA-binding MarR family transcriptional regulator